MAGKSRLMERSMKKKNGREEVKVAQRDFGSRNTMVQNHSFPGRCCQRDDRQRNNEEKNLSYSPDNHSSDTSGIFPASTSVRSGCAWPPCAFCSSRLFCRARGRSLWRDKMTRGRLRFESDKLGQTGTRMTKTGQSRSKSVKVNQSDLVGQAGGPNSMQAPENE
jgi:hypothetical protein